MNKLVHILSSAFFLLVFSFCSITKETTKETHPFKVTNATFNTWVGGQPGVKEIKVVIMTDNPEIALDSVFFRNMKTSLKADINAKFTTFVGIFTDPNNKKDYILHENPLNEYGNTPVNKSIKTPFILKENEAVVSYLLGNKTYYYKIDKVEEIKSSVKD